MSDEQLLQSYIKDHDKQAFQALFERYFAALTKWLVSRFHCDTGTAEDSVQTAFFRLSQQKQTDEHFDVHRWLKSMSAKKLRQHTTTTKPLKTNDDSRFDNIIEQSNLRYDREDPRWEIVNEHLNNLSPSQKEVFLRVSKGQSFQDVSKATGKSIGACKVFMTEAKSRLRQLVA